MLNSKDNNLRKAAMIIIPIFYLVLIIVLFLGFFEIIPLSDKLLLSLLYSGLGITVILVVFFLIIWILNIRKNREKKEGNYFTSNRKQDRLQPIIKKTPSRISIPQIRLSYDLLFKDKKEDIECGICKLEIRENQTAYQCPNCKTVFHAEHILNWLLKEPNCPICDFEFSRYII